MNNKTVLITGGAGYVGVQLVNALLQLGFRVKVVDLFLYGNTFEPHTNLELLRGDVRDLEFIRQALQNTDAVVYLACVSNDPGYEMDSQIGYEINYLAFEPFVKAARKAGVKRFLYPSSCSVYGNAGQEIKNEEGVVAPITDYAICKHLCEKVLSSYSSSEFATVILRPATIYGYSPRMRFDLLINQLTNQLYNSENIRLSNSHRIRPSLHILDMVKAYCQLLTCEKTLFNGKIFNIAYDNLPILTIGEKIAEILTKQPIFHIENSNDQRSYNVSSEKISRELGFSPSYGISDAVCEIADALRDGTLSETFSNPLYYNKMIQKKTLFPFYNIQ